MPAIEAILVSAIEAIFVTAIEAIVAIMVTVQRFCALNGLGYV